MRQKNYVHLIIVHTVLGILAIFCLGFFFIMLINATKTQTQLLGAFSPIPGTAGAENLQKVLSDSTMPILYGILNSMIVSAGSAMLAVFVSVLTAYGLFVYEFRLNRPMFTVIMMILVMPTQVCTLGFLRVIAGIGLEDNLLALILPAAASPAVFYFLYTYMRVNLNTGLIDAARIDGAGEWRIFHRIIIPLMRPAMSVQGIFVFISSWNNYFLPALVLETKRRKTLPVMLASMRSSDFVNKDLGKAYMMITVAIIPIIIAYTLLSKEVLAGVNQRLGEEDG